MPTNRAQSFAVGIMQRVDGNLKESIFAQERRQVDMGVFGKHQPGFTHRFFVERVELRELPVKRMRKFPQAAYTFELGVSFKSALNSSMGNP